MSTISKLFLDHTSSPEWAGRRRVIILSLIWEAVAITAIVAWAMVKVQPNPLLDTALTNLSALFGGTVGSYVFGAVWDRKVALTANVAQSAVDNAAGSTDGSMNTTVTVNP